MLIEYRDLNEKVLENKIKESGSAIIRLSSFKCFLAKILLRNVKSMRDFQQEKSEDQPSALSVIVSMLFNIFSMVFARNLSHLIVVYINENLSDFEVRKSKDSGYEIILFK